jgi:hypothetical protein
MNTTHSLSLETYRRGVEFHRVGNRAVRKAQEESRCQKVPNVFSHHGTLYYERPDGHLTATDPFGSTTRGEIT